MKNRCVIVAGGNCDLKHFEQISENDFIIAADSGLKYTAAAGITPDLTVGDFDSFVGEIPKTAELIRLPTEKDDTDLLFAMRCGVKRGFTDFLLLGAYGSRPDQNFAMLQSLVWLCDNCELKSVKVQCCDFEVYAVKNGSLSVCPGSDRYISVFAASSEAKGVTVKGAKYPLNNAVLLPSFPVGVSNESDGEVEVSVSDGTLIVMAVDKNI